MAKEANVERKETAFHDTCNSLYLRPNEAIQITTFRQAGGQQTRQTTMEKLFAFHMFDTIELQKLLQLFTKFINRKVS